ncbi:MAG: hypothetical protein R3F59_19870 [Myxococcota bacterium]
MGHRPVAHPARWPPCEPFGNAVHACQVSDLRGKSVAILGTGTIGLFAVLVARTA